MMQWLQTDKKAELSFAINMDGDGLCMSTFHDLKR